MQTKTKDCSSELAMEVLRTCPILMVQWQAHEEEWWTKVNKRTSTTPKFFTNAENDDAIIECPKGS